MDVDRQSLLPAGQKDAAGQVVLEGQVEIAVGDEDPVTIDANHYLLGASGEPATLSDDGVTPNFNGVFKVTADTNLNIRHFASEESRRLGGVSEGQVMWVRAATEGRLDGCGRRLPAAGGGSSAGRRSVLTERGREGLTVVGTGLTNTEIAEHLFLAEATIKTHIGHILAKLGLRDRVGIVVLAYDTGLVRPRT